MIDKIKIGDKVIVLEDDCGKCVPCGTTIVTIREDYKHTTIYGLSGVGGVERDRFITKEQAMIMFEFKLEEW